MAEFLELVARQLWKLTVLWPAWVLTPEGLESVWARMGWRRVALFALLVALAFAFSQVMPWAFSLAYAGDLVAYLDLAGVAVLLGAAVQLRQAIRGVRLLRRRRERRRRLVRARSRAARRSPGRMPPPANDDDPATWPLRAGLPARELAAPWAA